MASAPTPRCPAVTRRLAPSSARRVDPVSRRAFRALSRQHDDILYSLAPPAPLLGLEATPGDGPTVIVARREPVMHVWQLAALSVRAGWLRIAPRLPAQGRRRSVRLAVSSEVFLSDEAAILTLDEDRVPLAWPVPLEHEAQKSDAPGATAPRVAVHLDLYDAYAMGGAEWIDPATVDAHLGVHRSAGAIAIH